MSTFNELIDFTRSTTGTYLDSVVYGDESLTGSWTTVTGFDNITSGTGTNVTTASTSSGASRCYLQINNVEQGKQYKLTVTISQSNVSSLSVYLRDGASPNSGTLVAGQSGMQQGNTYTIMGVAESNLMGVLFIGTAASFTANVSVKEVIGGQVSGTPLLRTAAINEPRLEYDASGNPLGLLIEEGRTNVVTQSESFSSWNHDDIVVSVDSSITSPAGNAGVSKLTLSQGSGSKYIVAPNAIATFGDTACFSIWLKYGTHQHVDIYGAYGHWMSNNSGCKVDMLNGTVTDYTSSTESTIKEYPNGWYYVQVTSSTSMSGANANTFYLWASDASSGPIAGTTSTGYFYAWGAQTEAGSFPTSYIPTGGSTVTRAADVASLPVERFAYNQAQGSVVVEAVMPPSVISEQFWILGSNTNSARWFYSNSGDISLNAYDGASTSSASPLQPSATQKMAIGTDQSTKILCLDGVSGNQTNTTGNISSLTTVFYFGGNSSTPVVNFNGHIKHIQYYPKRLSNTELQLLTQPSASPTMNLTFDGQATSTLVEGLHD